MVLITCSQRQSYHHFYHVNPPTPYYLNLGVDRSKRCLNSLLLSSCCFHRSAHPCTCIFMCTHTQLASSIYMCTLHVHVCIYVRAFICMGVVGGVMWGGRVRGSCEGFAWGFHVSAVPAGSERFKYRDRVWETTAPRPLSVSIHSSCYTLPLLCARCCSPSSPHSQDSISPTLDLPTPNTLLFHIYMSVNIYRDIYILNFGIL